MVGFCAWDLPQVAVCEGVPEQNQEKQRQIPRVCGLSPREVHPGRGTGTRSNPGRNAGTQGPRRPAQLCVCVCACVGPRSPRPPAPRPAPCLQRSALTDWPMGARRAPRHVRLRPPPPGACIPGSGRGCAGRWGEGRGLGGACPFGAGRGRVSGRAAR